MPLPRVHTIDELPVDRPMDLIERRRIVGERVMLSHVRLAKGFKVDSHHHENEQLAIVVSGKIVFGLGDGSSVTLTAGQVLEIPSNEPHSAEALEDTLILDVFSPPSETTGVDVHKSPD